MEKLDELHPVTITCVVKPLIEECRRTLKESGAFTEAEADAIAVSIEEEILENHDLQKASLKGRLVKRGFLLSEAESIAAICSSAHKPFSLWDYLADKLKLFMNL